MDVVTGGCSAEEMHHQVQFQLNGKKMATENAPHSKVDASLISKFTLKFEGNEATINLSKTTEDAESDEKQPIVDISIQRLCIKGHDSIDSNDPSSISTPHKYRVSDISCLDSVTQDSTENEEVCDSKRYMLCLRCCVRFHNVQDYLKHGRDIHYIESGGKNSIPRGILPSLIQVFKNGEASYHSMKPITDEGEENSDAQSPIEDTKYHNPIHGSVDLSHICAKSGDETSLRSSDCSDMKMDDQDEMPIDSDPEIKPGSDSKTIICTEQEIPATDLALATESPVQKRENPPSRNHPTDMERASKSIACGTSENSRKTSSPLQGSNGKGSTKSKESMFGGIGGVTNLDPLFQMSLFQSRNSCKTLKCPKCNWHYKYRQTLDAHMREKHADETSDCLYCNTNQPHPRLSRGESYACGYKPFKCEVCNYSTTTKGNLSIHMQSDKHLYNVKTMQHQRQHHDKERAGGNAPSNIADASSSPTTKRQPSDSSPSAKRLKDTPSPTTSGGSRRQMWRCDVCNYETDIPRNLRIHMQSEKHSNNMALSGIPRERFESQKVIKREANNEDDFKSERPSSNPDQDQNNPLAALYYYLAAMQNPMQSQGGEAQENSKEREKQFLAHQQLLVAQQYQQMMSQFAGSNDAGSASSLIQQQLLMQQQMQLFRNVLSQDRFTNPAAKLTDGADISMHDMNNPESTSDQYLFTCGICCNFSCNDLESFCTHVRTPRYSRNTLGESEWVTKSQTDGYLCRICNYTTQLKTNFSLHCKTEKHTSKLQLINHIREGGESNEWKVSYAIAGNNMNKVTCNGCRHSTTSIDKLRIHCSTDRHQGTLTMCHYFDSMLKEAQSSSSSQDELISHSLSCHSCSYKSKFVVGMIQHMQSQSHQSKLHEKQQAGSYLSENPVTVEADVEISNAGRNSASMNATASNDVVTSEEEMKDQENKVYECKLCVFEASDERELEQHKAAQHFSQSEIKCPMCPEYLSDTTLFQAHLIEVHKLTEQVPNVKRNKTLTPPLNQIEGSPSNIQIAGPPEELEPSRLPQDSTGSPTKSVVEADTEVHTHNDKSGINADETDALCDQTTNCMVKDNGKEVDDDKTNEDVLHGDPAIFKSDMWENPAELLRSICGDSELAADVMTDSNFAGTWDRLNPPFTCSHCDETYTNRSDLLNHIKTSDRHAGKNISGCKEDGIAQSRSTGSRSPAESRSDTHQFKRGDDVTGDDTECVNGGLNQDNTDRENQGISKKAHKSVLQEVGFDAVSHFVENKSDENKEKAEQWKKEIAPQAGGDTEPTPSDSHQKQVTDLICVRCGKEFSNSWILKVHEKSVHNQEMSPEMLNEFIQGYTSWYWECLKQEAENGPTYRTDTNPSPCSTDEQRAQAPSYSKPAKNKSPASGPPPIIAPGDQSQDFQKAAMQAFAKNYPGLATHIPSGSPLNHNQRPGLLVDEQMKLQQQQMLLQFLMNTQAQSAMQQQSTMASNKNMNPANVPNIMNMLADQLYGAAMQGAASPGFMDPMAVMALLQQQHQSRMPGNSAVNQWLAMRYLQQQQQMQQLLMYPTALGGGSNGLPFPPNFAENNAQQQMLSAFAASLLASGMSQESLPQAFMANPVASMLQAYQSQAGSGSVPGKDPDPDTSKLLRAQQNSNASNSQLNQSQTEIPAKRPRTRITDDQLKVLRSNFDINTSPGEEQVAEMALKTNLPSKVIKHWFRNTLFKERQRSKDSPYNFNIPPMTSLDDVNPDFQLSQSDSPKGGPESPEETNDSIDFPPRRDADKLRDQGRDEPEKNTKSMSSDAASSNGAQNEALQILKSLGCNPTKIAEAQHKFYSNPMAYMAKLTRTKSESSSSLQIPPSLALASGSEDDYSHSEQSHYMFNRSVSHMSNDYPYSNASSAAMNSITRRTPRTRFSDYQLKVLQDFFDKNAYPKDEDLDRLSRMLELSTRVIVVWFQNARQKARKSYEMTHGPISQHAPSNVPSFSTVSRKRNLSPQSPTGNKPTLSLDLHAASKNFNVTRDVSNENFRAADLPSPNRRGKSDYAEAGRDHEKCLVDTTSNNPPPKHSEGESSAGSTENVPVKSENNPVKSESNLIGTKAATSTPHSLNDIISRFGMHDMMKYENSGYDVKSVTSSHASSPFLAHGGFLKKQAMPAQNNQMSPGSLADAMGNRALSGFKRKGMSEPNKDPKRLRTTITPEQLEFLYQQYLVDSSPSRKVIEQISDIVGLKKRVVQVWFQNTRARERKGQFRSVGRITAVLGMPQTCPHCRVTFRTKADLDAHVRYRHMQSPSSTSIAMSQSKQISPGATFPSISSTSRDDSRPSQEKDIDYKDIFAKHAMEKDLASQSTGSSEHGDVYESSNGEPDAKRRKESNDSDQFKPVASNASGDFSLRTAEIYKAVTEQIFGTKVAMSNQHRREQSVSSTSSIVNATAEYRGVSPPAVSSPESMGSATNSFMVPSKRYRTQMTALQVNALKHCFSQYKTPTLLECEILGEHIGLPKRVIQVWFQNARAKEKKARQGDIPPEQPNSPAKSSCHLCPEVRFGSAQDYRNHVFSKFHLQNFVNSVEGEAPVSALSECANLSPGYDSDEYAQRDSPSRSRGSSPPRQNTEAKYRVSAIATANGLPVPLTENRTQSLSSWSPDTLARRYQQLSAMQELAAKTAASQSSGDNNSQDSNQPDPAVLQKLRQAWLQEALLANGFHGDSAARPFEGVTSSQATTQAD